MESATATHVRIFLPGEFTPPSGWPEDVGIAAVRTGGTGSEIFPVHRHESGAALLRRIEDLSGIALGAAAVHPPVEGHPACDLPFSTLRDLLSGIEAFLADTPEAVEEADDFAVNFAFAAEEGIDISGAFASPARDAAASRDPHPGPAVLPGYAPVAPGAGRPRPFPSAVLRIDASGEALVILDPLAPPGDIATPKVLLRDDGLGFAVHRQAAEGDARPPYALRLPAGCLPGAIERLACDIPLVASERADHLLFTPLPEFATCTTAPYPPLGAAPADTHPSPHKASRPVEAAAAWRRVRGIAAATAIAMLAGAVLLASAQTPALPPETPVDALRAGLFRTAP